MSAWRLSAAIALASTAVFALLLGTFGEDEAGLRALVRGTARQSFLLFLPVYVASSLRRLWPTPASVWLLRNRRYLGVGFAWSHFLHLLAIGMLAITQGVAFETDPIVLGAGGLAYALLFAMVLTSCDGAAQRIGPRRWSLLHRAGIHWLWVVFAFDWTGLASEAPLLYAPFAALAWGAAALRFAAWRVSRASAARSLAAMR